MVTMVIRKMNKIFQDDYRARKMLFLIVIFLLIGNMTCWGSASPLQNIDGLYFWHGDTNYPVYDTGNRFCSALDASSAYIVSDNDEELVIAVSLVSISYGSDEIVDVHPGTFREDKHTGKASLCHEASGMCRHVGGSKLLNDAYYYLKTCLGRG